MHPEIYYLLLGILVVLLVIGAIAIYNFFEGETFFRDCWDELALSRKSLNELDDHCFRNPNRSDITVSMTTTPTRINMLVPTIKSLLRQTKAPARIVINIPRWSKRENRPYEIPQFLLDLKSAQIQICEDFGPATKLIPTLLTSELRAPILVLDDDRIYPNKMISEISERADLIPDTALGFSGWIVPNDLVDRPTTLIRNLFQIAPAPIRCRRLDSPKEVDILQGYSGYLVRPSFFDTDQLCNYSKAPTASYFVDDVWISAHCLVRKVIIPSRRSNYQPKLRRRFFKQSSLGLINRGPGDPLLRSNTIVLRHFRARWIAQRDKDSRSPTDTRKDAA